MTGPRRSRPCTCCGKAPARLYAGGWRCDEHAPPRQPTPPPGTTLADLLRERRSTSYSDAIAARKEQARRRRAEAEAR